MTFYKFAVGVVLALAMIVVLGLSALVFSARDFQYGVQMIAPQTGGLVSFAELRANGELIDQIEDATRGPRGEQREVANQIATLDGQITTATNSADAARAAIVGGIAEVERSANVNSDVSAAADTSANALARRVNALAARSGMSPNDQSRVAQLRAQVQQLAEQEQTLDDLTTQRADLAGRQRLVGGQVQEADRRILALQAEVVPGGASYDRVRGEADALQRLSPAGVSAYLAQGHPALLSTLLAVLMGALGSLLYLFPAYLNRPLPVTMAEIVVRLIFGMCAALAFYVLANAAIAGFAVASTAPAAAGTSSTLNPFTVSLVGIVAGVMSEDIAKWIQERGRGFLTQGGVAAQARAQADAAAVPGGGLVNNQAIS